MPGPLKEKWNEFDWERELRKDDARISTYMSELPRYIDLPDEDAVIMKQIQRRPELIPQGADWEGLPLQSLFDEIDYDDEYMSGDDWQKRDGADVYMLFSRLSCQWAETFASSLNKDAVSNGLRILCLYGKLMARTADILDFDSDEYPALRIAICKRIAHDVDRLLGEFMDIKRVQPGIQTKADSHTAHLQQARERMLDVIAKLRA